MLARALDRWAPAFVVGLAYAVTDEIHQHFVRGRNGNPVDAAIDALGVALGVFACRPLRP